jgi:hypothetical protein
MDPETFETKFLETVHEIYILNLASGQINFEFRGLWILKF